MDTKTQAEAYCQAFRQWRFENRWAGMGNMIPANAKPCSVSAPDLSDKHAEAVRMLEQNYWQMPFERARIKFYGIPRAKWEEGRRRAGLPI